MGCGQPFLVGHRPPALLSAAPASEQKPHIRTSDHLWPRTRVRSLFCAADTSLERRIHNDSTQLHSMDTLSADSLYETICPQELTQPPTSYSSAYRAHPRCPPCPFSRSAHPRPRTLHHLPAFFPLPTATPSTGLLTTVFDSEGLASVFALGCGAELHLMGFDSSIHLGTTVNCAGLTCWLNVCVC